MNIYYTQKGTAYVWASELREELGIKTQLRTWFPRMIEYGFTENEDYYQTTKNVRLVQGGFNEVKDWAVNIEMAKHVAMIQRTEKGKALRKYLISLDTKVQEGDLLNRQQLSVLFDLCRVFGLFSVQKYLENEHYEVFDNKTENWWSYRARVLGYSTSGLKASMKAIGKKYKSQRQALMHLDKYELIRMATIDLFKAMGKTDEYAKNVGEFTKEIAKEMKPDIYDDRMMAIDFKTPEQKETISKLKDRNKANNLLDKF